MLIVVDSHSLAQLVLLVPDAFASSIVGGGTAFLFLEPGKFICTPTATLKSFEISTVAIKFPHSNLALYNIYRSSQSITKSRHSWIISISRRLSESHAICINFSSWIPNHRRLQHLFWLITLTLINEFNSQITWLDHLTSIYGDCTTYAMC